MLRPNSPALITRNYLYRPQCSTVSSGLALVTWNSQSGNSRGRESLEVPLEFPARKRPFLGNSLEFPSRGGSVHTEGLFLHTEGGVLVAFRTGTPQNFLHAVPWLLICRGGYWLLVSLPSERARHLKSAITK